jgi:hypothetical protein
MEQGLFFDRVDRFCTHLSKGSRVKGAVLVDPDTTDAMLPVLYMTPVTAEGTFDFKAFCFPVLPRLMPVFHEEENNRVLKR